MEQASIGNNIQDQYNSILVSGIQYLNTPVSKYHLNKLLHVNK